MRSVNLVHSEEIVTKAKKRRVVLEDIEETQTINFFDSFATQNLEKNIENADKMLEHDPCIVPAEKVTLREYDNIDIGVESMFNGTVSCLIIEIRYLISRCD